jgi:hypothetical protein
MATYTTLMLRFRRLVPALVLMLAPMFGALSVRHFLLREWEHALRLAGAGALFLVLWLLAITALAVLDNIEMLIPIDYRPRDE